MYWVFDGLDGAGPPGELILNPLEMRSRMPIKLLFFSRPDIDHVDLERLNMDATILEPISSQTC